MQSIVNIYVENWQRTVHVAHIALHSNRSTVKEKLLSQFELLNARRNVIGLLCVWKRASPHFAGRSGRVCVCSCNGGWLKLRCIEKKLKNWISWMKCGMPVDWTNENWERSKRCMIMALSVCLALNYDDSLRIHAGVFLCHFQKTSLTHSSPCPFRVH